MPHQTGCVTPCNCHIDEDGYWAERPQDGRRNTNVSGSGTIDDPITISFMQSEEFRTHAAEVRSSGGTVQHDVPRLFAAYEYEITVYQTPSEVLIRAGVAVSIVPHIMFSNYFLAGASATFASNGTGERQVSILTDNPTQLFSLGVAAQVQPGIGTRNSTLTCSAFVPGLLDKSGSDAGRFDKRIAPFVVGVYQASGGPLNVSNIKLWASMV